MGAEAGLSRHRRSRGRRRPRGVVVALLLVAAMGAQACDGSEEDPATSSSSSSTENGGSSASTDGGGGSTRRIAFVPPGPTDPDTPVGNEWYELLSEGRCQQVLDSMDEAGVDPEFQPEVSLYRAAARACLGDWDVAEAAFDDFGPSRPSRPEICGRAEVFDWVAMLLQARRADPDLSPTFVEASPEPPCPDETTTTTEEGTTTTTDDGTTTTTDDGTTTTTDGGTTTTPTA